MREKWILSLLFIIMVIRGEAEAGLMRRSRRSSRITTPISLNNNTSSPSRCDYFKGRWIVDFAHRYNYTDCPFIEKEFNCLKNGRPDLLYLHYSWKPDSCNLARFNFSTSFFFFSIFLNFHSYTFFVPC